VTPPFASFRQLGPTLWRSLIDEHRDDGDIVGNTNCLEGRQRLRCQSHSETNRYKKCLIQKYPGQRPLLALPPECKARGIKHGEDPVANQACPATKGLSTEPYRGKPTYCERRRCRRLPDRAARMLEDKETSSVQIGLVRTSGHQPGVVARC
jgi:hypothetical protein